MAKEHIDNVISLRAELDNLRLQPESKGKTAEILIKLAGMEFRNDPAIARQHAKEALALALETGLDTAIAESYHICSLTAWSTEQFKEALFEGNESLVLWEKLGDTKGIARALNNLGNIHRELNNYDKALEFHLKSLEIKEKNEDKKGIAISHLNIGNTYKDQGHLSQAVLHYTKAKEIYQSIGSELDIAKCFNNIGIILERQCAFEYAAEQHLKALKIREELNDTRGLSNSYGSLGSICEKQNNLEGALDYYNKALLLAETLSARKVISLSCLNVGSVSMKLGDLHSAYQFIKRGMQTARAIGAKSLEAEAMSQLADLYKRKGEFKEAFICERKYRKIKEDLFSEETANKIALLHVKFEMEEKQREADINRTKNAQLEKEIAERRRIEVELKEHRDHLEALIEERTSELLKVNTGLEKSITGTIFIISRIIEERDPYSSGHQTRTAELAREIARVMNLSEKQVQAVYLAAMVHDIGKIRVPQEFLSRSGKLSKIELNVVRAYPQTGYDILKSIEFPWPIAKIVLQHHEFLDGSGYPSGLKKEEIMLEARILSVADVVTAMLSRRPYRPAFDIEVVLEELYRNKEILYDSDCVDACVYTIHQGKFRIRE